MSLLNNRDVQRYIKMMGIGIVVFALAAVGLYWYFLPDNEVVLRNNTIEYGDDVKIVELVDNIGNQSIDSDSIVSSNTLILDKYEVTFDDINTSKLGEQTLNVVFSDPTISDASVKISVVDTKKPTITFLVKEKETVKLETMKKKDWKALVKVTDNHSSGAALKVDYSIDKDKVDYGDTFSLKVVATDKSGNTSTKSIKLKVEEKPKEEKKEEKKEESKSDVSSNNTQQATTPSTSSNGNSSTQQQQAQPSQQQSQPAPQQTQPSQSTTNNVTPQNGQTYNFNDGYDMNTAPSACSSALQASGASGSCVPIVDENGRYQGMQLVQ